MRPLLVFLTALVAPAQALACIGSFESYTSPGDFTLWGLAAGLLLLLTYDKALQERRAMAQAILLSCVIAGYGLGFFVSTHPERWTTVGWGWTTLFFFPLGFARYSSTPRRRAGMTLALVCTGLMSWFLFEANEGAHDLKTKYTETHHMITDVTF